jgi:hypothetical protein
MKLLPPATVPRTRVSTQLCDPGFCETSQSLAGWPVAVSAFRVLDEVWKTMDQETER